MNFYFELQDPEFKSKVLSKESLSNKSKSKTFVSHNSATLTHQNLYDESFRRVL